VRGSRALRTCRGRRRCVKILALDTATQHCGVALLDENTQMVSSRRRIVTTHSETLLSLVSECLAEQSASPHALSCVALCAGPGSFTGLRIGCATAKGLCYALSLPLVLVSSLGALASAHAGERSVLATMDAFRDRVYARLVPSEHASGALLDVLKQTPTLLEDTAWDPAILAERLATVSSELLVLGNGAARYPVLSTLPGVLAKPEVTAAPDVFARLGLEKWRQGDVAHLASALPTYITVSAAEDHVAMSSKSSDSTEAQPWTR